jgi:hypothetical protein
MPPLVGDAALYPLRMTLYPEYLLLYMVVSYLEAFKDSPKYRYIKVKL